MRREISIRTKRDFERLYRGGRRVARGELTVFVAPSEAEHGRLGLAVSARGAGAVVRNRIKRRVRAAFGRCAPEPAVDVVVRARSEVADMAFPRLVELLCGAIDDARVAFEGRR